MKGVTCCPRRRSKDFFLELIGRKNPGALYRYHQDWVEGLKRAAEAKAAPVEEPIGRM
jgi:hypothetical protein